MSQRAAWYWFARLVLRRVSCDKRPGLTDAFHDAWHLVTHHPSNLLYRMRHPVLMAQVDRRVRLHLKGIGTLDA